MTALATRLTRGSTIVLAGALLIAYPAIGSSPAMAATTTITITPSGFVPMNLAIKSGDTISFTNADTVVHEVRFKATKGFTCTATPVVVQPTTTQSCTWSTVGTYTYSDPNQQARTFRGTITVTPATPAVAPTVSLDSSSAVVVYGGDATLSGSVKPTTAVTTVDILAMASGESVYTKVASATTTAAGTYTVNVTPEILTSYRAEYQNGSARVVSPVSAVQSRPQVGLVRRSATAVRALFAVRVTSGLTYASKFVLVQRMNRAGSWTTLKRATLGSLSTARFAVRLTHGTTRIRTVLPASQAGIGYVSSSSRTISLSR